MYVCVTKDIPQFFVAVKSCFYTFSCHLPVLIKLLPDHNEKHPSLSNGHKLRIHQTPHRGEINLKHFPYHRKDIEEAVKFFNDPYNGQVEMQR
jgi:hypothetical protein